MRVQAMAGLLATLCLAGCTTGDAGGAPAGIAEEPIDPELAQLEGQVVDEELRALNATIRVTTLERIVETDADGRFRLVNLQPGTHDVLATAYGYEAQARQVELRPGLTTLTFTLRPVGANGTYHETFPFVGHEPCQWYFEGTLSHCTFPYTAAHGTAKRNGVNLTQYGLPPDLQENKAFFNFSVRPDNTGIVSELVWRAGSAGAAIQALIMMCPWYDPFWDECVPPGSSVTTGVRYSFTRGTSPIRVEWKHPTPAHLELTPYVWSRANVNGDDAHPVGVAFDQKVDFYNTVFYGEEPPDGYTAGPRDG